MDSPERSRRVQFDPYAELTTREKGAFFFFCIRVFPVGAWGRREEGEVETPLSQDGLFGGYQQSQSLREIRFRTGLSF